MADKTITERLQPSLLDRLTDMEPAQKSEGREDRVIDVRRLRIIIQRDLAWLLNASNQDTLIDADIYPHVATSVLNYGVRDFTGDFSTKLRVDDIRKAIARAIELFEPRINEGTLEVILRQSEDINQSVVDFDIRADIWAQPLPMELYLRSRVDLITGHLSLEGSG